MEVGALLKRERERLGISLRDVMDATKISRRNLMALEDGQVKALPHPVYLKGYVRNIAKMVGLDADELAKVVDRQYDHETAKYLAQAATAASVGAPPAAEAPAASAPRPEDPAARLHGQNPAQEAGSHKHSPHESLPPLKQKSSGSLLSVLSILLLLGILGGLLVQYQRIVREAPPEPVPAALPAVNATVATEQDNATNSTALESAAPEALQAEPAGAASTQPALEPQRTTPQGPTAQSVLASSTPSAPATSIEVSRKAPPAEARATGVQQLTVTAKANESCWVEVFDGQQAKSFILRNGESRQVEFRDRMRVRLGNAGGVSFRLNGQDYPYEGKRGSLETLEIGTR